MAVRLTPNDDDEWLRSGVGRASADEIEVAGRDLANELMGQVSFSQLAFLLVSGRMPSAAQLRYFDAVLVSLTDHGLTPTVLAARLTLTGAPESLQGAMAAGLLGGGSVLLGPTETVAVYLSGLVDEHELSVSDPESRYEEVAEREVARRREQGERLPGLGHPIHKELDPRVPRMVELAQELDLFGPHLRLLLAVEKAQAASGGPALPVNGAGAAGAALADLGLPPSLARGFALLARTAGLIAHLAEEKEQPLGMKLFLEAQQRMIYERDDA